MPSLARMSDDEGVVRASNTAELESELEQTKAELAELQESYRRLAADLDNQRRRSREQAERAAGRERGEVLRELLGIVDDLDRAQQASAESSDDDLRAGLEAVRREAHRILERRGVKRMDSVGKAFDPERHEAVGLAEGGAGMVHAEVRPGYLLEGDVLRPAEVLVGKSEGR